MAAEGATTPRGRRSRSMGVTSIEGSISHESLADDSSEVHLKKYSSTVDDLLRRVTEGAVKVEKAIVIAQTRCEFTLSLNSLAFEEVIRTAVSDLSIPWEVLRTEYRGVRKNPHSIASDGLETGFATLIINRRGLYVPETSTWKLVAVAIVILAGFAVWIPFFQWLVTM